MLNLDLDDLEVGFDIPAKPGMAEDEIQTPCLILDLDALELNLRKMRDICRRMGIQHRPHAKMHKSVEIAKLQMDLGGAAGICCQKGSEAEVFVRAGIRDVLISNQIRDPIKIQRLAKLPQLGAKLTVCVDDARNVIELSDAAVRHGTTLNCLIEVECGAGRCGVANPQEAVALARSITAADGLNFTGVQAYQGAMQHVENFEQREALGQLALSAAAAAVTQLEAEGFPCEIVTGGGTGSFELEASSGVYTEIQCGSYAFMDADYGRIRASDGRRLDDGHWKNALFLLSSIMSVARPGLAICDAGLKSHSMDSGLPIVFGRPDLHFASCNDEHGIIQDPNQSLRINQRLRLVPGHCDPTCNLHDWYVGVRAGKVEHLWPVSARGKSY